jgi:plasmid stabilization system protein ParE
MRKLLASLIIILAAGLIFTPEGPAVAQSRGGDLSASLQRLQNNPRYQGRIIGTQIRRTARGALYEVQILRPDDRVIVVYIDPATGGVVGDSQRRGSGGGSAPGRRGRGQGRGNN